MRFNDKELAKLGECKADLEGILHHMRPQGTDWSNWYQQTSFKERYCKLIANLLFYYRAGEQEPLGVLVLENAHIAYERPHKGIPFAFSITFKINDKFKDNEAKHIFSCRCEEDVNKWVSALKVHSYQYWRSQYVILKTKISMKTGQDPVLDYMRSKHANMAVNDNKTKKCKEVTTRSKFYSHVESSSTKFYQSSYSTETQVTQVTTNIPVDNLIDL